MSKIYVVGSVNMDLLINADVFPEAGMTVSGYGFMTNPGGKGANQAVAVSKLGGKAVMVGAVGKEFGNELINALQGYGVDTENVYKAKDVSSGLAVIAVSQGENRIILDKGANALVSEEFARKALEGAEAGDYLIVQLEIPLKTVYASLKIAKTKGMITVLNPAPACKLPEGIFNYVDYFIPNQTETEFYTDIYPDTIRNATVAAEKLLKEGVKNVVITMGKNGSLFTDGKRTSVCDACLVKAVDTTAAGDTFVGAFVTRLSEGESVETAMKFANKASSVTVTRRGAQQSIPYIGEIG